MICIGYIIASNDLSLTVVLPEKPLGKLKMKLPQKSKKVDAECYDKYELKAFDITLDGENKVTDWSCKNVEKYVDVKYFVALLADGRILADDGKTYKLWDNRAIQDANWISQYDYMFSGGTFNSIRNIRLYVRNGIIYGSYESEDYKFRNGWDIEDVIAQHLNGFDRYKVSDMTASRTELFAQLY